MTVNTHIDLHWVQLCTLGTVGIFGVVGTLGIPWEMGNREIKLSITVNYVHNLIYKVILISSKS